jgi:hypothetical protein
VTLDEAKVIRAMQVCGKPVKATELQRALIVIEESKPLRPGSRRQKMRLPALSPHARMKVNAVLLFRLGLELGRIEGARA